MKRSLYASLLLLSAPGFSVAQASLTDAGYGENFDALGDFGQYSNGQRAAWKDNQTLTGWYTNMAVTPTLNGSPVNEKLYYIMSDPAQNTQQRRLGSVGHSQLSSDWEDRALSFNGSNQDATLGNLYVGLRIRNDSGHVIDAIDVSYVGELWSRSRSDITSQQPLSTLLGYKVGATGVDDTGFTNAAGLGFTNTSIPFQGQFVNGNDPANQVQVSGKISGLSLAPGQDLWLRFQSPYPGAVTSGLNAIDDLRINVAPVPEPASLVAVGMGALVLLRRRRR